MICHNCADGGDRTRSARMIPDIRKTQWIRRGVEIGLRLAREAHAACTGCDCQHRVPATTDLPGAKR